VAASSQITEPAKLASEHVFTIQRCVQSSLKELEKLHWSVLPFMKAKGKSAKAAQFAALEEIRKQERAIESAMEAISALYSSQFPDEIEE
jgi:hypothetical protein